jgi:hypothetical protein
MSERLRYTGVQATVFETGHVGCVEPGGEFAVDASLLLRFMRRPDIEHAGGCPAPPCRCGQEPEPAGALEHPGYGELMTGTGHPADGTWSPPVSNGVTPDTSDDTSRVQDADTSGGTPSGRRGRTSGPPSGKGAAGGTQVP